MIDFGDGSRDAMCDWIANTVHDVSGIWPQHLRGSARKRVLTCVKTGAVACQEIRQQSFDDWFQALMRGSTVVVTNVVPFTQKPR